jgi:hypothetical protein
MGPIDWSYDFMQHAQSDQERTRVEECIDRLREIEKNPADWLVTIDGGWPRIGWQEVISVRMYDGWPWWRPVPSVLMTGTLGSEWHHFLSITNIRNKTTKELR